MLRETSTSSVRKEISYTNTEPAPSQVGERSSACRSTGGGALRNDLGNLKDPEQGLM